jgi:hypothetical protein
MRPLVPTPLPSGRVSTREFSPGLIVPNISPEGVVINPVRPIWQHKFGGGSFTSNRGKHSLRWRKAFAAYTRSEFGLSVRESEILAGRPKGDLLRILKNLDCLLDNFLLFDENFFRRETLLYRALIKMIKVTLIISTYSIDDQIGKWKDFVNQFVTLSSKAIVRGQISMKWNPYKYLYDIGLFKEILEGNLSRYNMVSLSHIISTRNLINGGKAPAKKALNDFKVLTSSNFEVSDSKLNELELAAKRVSGIAAKLSGRNGSLKGAHVSLNSAGTLDVPVSGGGKAADARIDLSAFLDYIPERGETYEYPWGPRYYRAGYPRWQAWGHQNGEPAKFLSPSSTDIIDRGAQLHGCNEYTGSMLFTAAYHLYEAAKGSPIPIRQCSVSEPGGKARIITTGPWWLTVLQQPFVHMAKELIGFHPSAHSCLLRCDQAWQALKVLERSDNGALRPDHFVLSSDLKSATDAIPHSVCKALLRGFFASTNSKDWEWLIDLVDLRTVFCEDGSIHTLRRGVMMGEPLSKVCLVLLGLAIEELAYSKYMSISLKRTWTERKTWRAFHLGGDDHLAIGPKGYLDLITKLHQSYGSIISPDKHRISRLYSVYTEKILLWKNTQINWSVQTTTTDDCPFIDSIKIRLLSPFTKAMETCNDKNVAIGKCRGLSRSLEYFDIRNMKRTVIDRMIYRFRDFVKGPHRRTIFAVECLPTALGGLGLGIDKRYLEHLPGCFNQAIRQIYHGGSEGYRARIELGRIFANSVPRGVQGNDFVEAIIDQLLSYADYPEFADEGSIMSRTEALDIVDPDRENTYAYNLWLLAKKDIVPLGNIEQIAQRPFLFRKLLEQVGTGRSYRTESTRNRIRSCWTKLEEFGFTTSPEILVEEELDYAVKISKMVVFVNLKNEIQMGTVDTTIPGYTQENAYMYGDYKVVTLKRFLTYGEPSMKVILREPGI